MGFPECFGKVFVTLIPSLQLGWAVELRNNVWVNSHLPRSRHEALVSSMIQKGHAAMCAKYRQLLLAIGYKLVASFLLSGILDAGGETRIWNKQFGVRFGRGTVDSILIARRLVESALSATDGKLVLLVLVPSFRQCGP